MTIDHATAHRAWDARWREAAGNDEWLQPEPEVLAVAQRQPHAGACLDLGCGLGRHALALARLGWKVSALDGSVAGLDHLRLASRREHLGLSLHAADFRSLPFADAAFDLLVCWNVVYHGTRDDLAAAFREISRVLAPGGTLIATLLSQRNGGFGIGREVSPDTWVVDDGGEKSHPHCYVDADGAMALLRPHLRLRRLEDCEHRKPGSWHWHVEAQRAP